MSIGTKFLLVNELFLGCNCWRYKAHCVQIKGDERDIVIMR
jgi:hypothetical protein